MIRVRILRSKEEYGCPKPEFDSYNYHNQDWRYESFYMECAAGPLWNLLERSVDFEKVAGEIIHQVMEI
jgi:hypothetical protein